MKAWIAGQDGGYYIALVYAETRNKARRALAGYYDETEYIDIRAVRCPNMDDKWAKQGVCEDEDLMIASGRFWVCEEHGRLGDEDLMCGECWRERHD